MYHVIFALIGGLTLPLMAMEPVPTEALGRRQPLLAIGKPMAQVSDELTEENRQIIKLCDAEYVKNASHKEGVRLSHLSGVDEALFHFMWYEKEIRRKRNYIKSKHFTAEYGLLPLLFGAQTPRQGQRLLVPAPTRGAEMPLMNRLFAALLTQPLHLMNLSTFIESSAEFKAQTYYIPWPNSLIQDKAYPDEGYCDVELLPEGQALLRHVYISEDFMTALTRLQTVRPHFFPAFSALESLKIAVASAEEVPSLQNLKWLPNLRFLEITPSKHMTVPHLHLSGFKSLEVLSIMLGQFGERLNIDAVSYDAMPRLKKLSLNEPLPSPRETARY